MHTGHALGFARFADSRELLNHGCIMALLLFGLMADSLFQSFDVERELSVGLLELVVRSEDSFNVHLGIFSLSLRAVGLTAHILGHKVFVQVVHFISDRFKARA
jgi:hypothetical protein